MRALVTGASGFIGRAAVERLALGGRFEVIAASRRPIGVGGNGVSEAAVDLLVPGAAADLVASVRPTHLLHLAWNARPGVFWTDPDNLDWTAATLSLTRAFIGHGGRRAVMAGSCAEYDWNGGGRLSEDSPLRPATLYGVAKDAARRAVCAGGEAAGVPVAWGRVFWLYGPYEAPGRLVSDVCRALVAGRRAAVGRGLERRDFLHVDDAAAAFVSALNGDNHGAFNVGSGFATSVRDVVSMLAKAAGRPDLVAWGARPDTPGAPSVIEADMAHTRSSVGPLPQRPLDHGLAETLSWWRERLHR